MASKHTRYILFGLGAALGSAVGLVLGSLLTFWIGEETLRAYLTHRPAEDEPSHARTHYWLGLLYEKQGRKADARANYAASLKLNPSSADVKDAMKRVS